MVHVAVLILEDDQFRPTGSLLGELATIWQELGVRVTVLQGPARPVAADAIILHVDRTIVPTRYLDCLTDYPLAINGGVVDISKRQFSQHLLRNRRDGGGPVIVKTDRNCGGIGEARSIRREGGIPRYIQTVRGRLPWSWRAHLAEYPTYKSPQHVPFSVWMNRDLVVERFLPERHDGYYCLRTWLFMGDRERIALFYSNEPVVKGRNIVGREVLTDVPADLREMRRELKFDFGKFDFGIVDGRTVLYDVNRTPTLSHVSRAQCLPWLPDLAEGLWSFLPRPTP